MMREQPFVPLLPGERAAAGDVPHAVARLLAVHGRGPLDRRHGPEDHRGADRRRRQSERQLRVIDHDQDGSMEMKKREGYF